MAFSDNTTKTTEARDKLKRCVETKNAASSLLDDYLTERELAEELGICLMTLRRWRVMAETPPITRIGVKIYYRRDAVADWLKSRQIDLEVS